MSFLALMVFSFCIWAVFSHHFIDGIVAKHLFVFSAITAAIVFLDPVNYKAAIASVFLLGAGLVYWYYRHEEIREHYRKHYRQRQTDRRAP